MSGKALVLRGDARAVPLPDASVDLVVTSPPYFNLRAYTDGGEMYAGQLGAEATPHEYIANLVECTREWMRVLKPTGSCWVDLGDKYAGNVGTTSGHRGSRQVELNGWSERRQADFDRANKSRPNRTGIPNKSLMLLPERYRIACVDQLGLIARAVVVWSKPNGLPESVTDRVRRSHEDWVHLVKQPRYYTAVDEIREGHEHHRRDSWDRRPKRIQGGIRPTGNVDARAGNNPRGKLPGSVWEIAAEPLTVPDHLGVDHWAAMPTELPRRIILGWSPPGICVECDEGRRPITVITPMEIRPSARRLTAQASGNAQRTATGGTMIRPPTSFIAGYVCACTPYTDHPATGATTRRGYSPGPRDNNAQGTYGRHQAGEYERVGPWREYHFDQWTPAPTRPAVILDPLGGTGTTALVAKALGRIGITVDMSMDYCRLATWRTTDRGQLAKAMRVPKPPPQVDGQGNLFDLAGDTT